MRQSGFRALDGVLVRASTVPDDLRLPPWPDLDCEEALAAWVAEVWRLPKVAEAVTVASPDLGAALAALAADPGSFRPGRVRSAASSLMRYLLRWRSRATPFGLFAGVAPVSLAEAGSLRWGQHHTVVRRTGSLWLSETVSALERDPDLLRRVQVLANNVGFVRGGDWVLDYQPTDDSTVSEVSVRHTAAVALVVREARAPIVFGDLVAKLAAGAPGIPVAVIEEMLTELVRRRVLLTSLRPPVTVTDPHAYLTRQLDGIGAVPGPAGDCAETSVRLDCTISLPRCVVGEVEKTAALLARLAPPRTGWAAYHAAFTDRYGPGAVVAVRDLVDPHRGLGYPAGYRDSTFPDPRPSTRRDLVLAARAQQAVLDGCAELVVDEGLLAELETASAVFFPHTELRVSIAAPDTAAVDRGDFALTVVCASRHAGTSVGRFLHLLEEADRERIADVYRALPTATEDAAVVQVAAPTLWRRIDGLTRVPPVLPVLPVGEYLTPGLGGVDVDDLAVTADAHRLVLMSLSTGRPVEPLMLNAVDLRHGVHPLARFLVEVSTATCAPCMPFYWGPVAETFVFLPRVRHGRSVLAPARWILTSHSLPPASAETSVWVEAFDAYRRARRVPDRVRVGAEDVLVRLDLTCRSHLQLLRQQLGRAGTVTVTEDLADDRWMGGRPHEIVVPLASTVPPRPLSRPFRPERLRRGPDHLPGISPWLYVNVYGHPSRQDDVLASLHQLLDGGWEHGTGEWWFIRYSDPAPHLRVRIRLQHADQYGAAAHAVGQWARSAHLEGLLAHIVLDTYRPESGRFGTGPALAAVEAVFAADTALVLARLESPMGVQAATAAGVLDLARGFFGDHAPRWLVEHLTHGGGPPLDRQTVQEALQPSGLPPRVLERHRAALAAYRALTDPSEACTALTDLIHLHHARMVGIGVESEKTCLRVARAAAQILLARSSGGAR